MQQASEEYQDLLCASGDNSELERIRDFVSRKASDFGFDDATTQKITLAVDEACSNVIRHSYKFDTEKQICISIGSIGEEFIIKIFDEGGEFNPLKVESPDMSEYLKNFKKGGLGIHIIKLIMDEIQYTPNVGDPARNMLCLKKYLH